MVVRALTDLATLARPAGGAPAERHQAAVATTLGWADAAAARGDHADALAWLETIEAIGDVLTGEYHLKRRVWQGALIQTPARGVPARAAAKEGNDVKHWA